MKTSHSTINGLIEFDANETLSNQHSIECVNVYLKEGKKLTWKFGSNPSHSENGE